uniref:H0307D04.14 protein n=1 Tax=Oryza sativa TaxID=4530 RepID=Q01K52_ORYSA|nr:H0307D04.14 [Oryza sativa]
MAERNSRAVAGCGRSRRRASPTVERRQRSAAVERRLWAEQPRAVAAVVVGSPPSSSPWARLHGAAVRRHRPGVAVAVHRWLKVPADDAPQSLTLLLCRGSGSGGGGSVAGLIPWSSRTPSSRSCSRSVSTLGVPSASWTVVGAGAVTLVVFADLAVALDVVAHTHIRRVQTAACTCVFV